MKKMCEAILVVLVVLSMAGCSTSSAVTSTQEPGSTTGQKPQSEGEKESLTSKSDKQTFDAAVVYFSGTGNTAAIAQTMAQVLNTQIYEILPANPYTEDDLNYSNDDCRANKEQNDDAARPEIANDLKDITKFKTIYLGYPVWWGTNPKIIQTFLESYDLSGKTIYTFCTSGGSGIGKSVSNLQELYPNVNIVSGHRFQTNDSEKVIADWINELQ